MIGRLAWVMIGAAAMAGAAHAQPGGPAAVCMGEGAFEQRAAACEQAISSTPAGDPQYVDVVVTMMNLQIAAGRPADAVRYGDMIAAGRTGADAAVTRCTVRVMAKWDLDAALAACSSGGAGNAAAMEMRGQVNLLAGRWQAAWDDFDAAYRAARSTPALLLRGLAAAGMGRMADSSRDVSAAEQAEPGITKAYEADGYALAAVSAGAPLVTADAMRGAVTLAAAPAAPVVPRGAGQPVAVRFAPDEPRGTVPMLGAAEVDACENEIRSLQTESQTWQGTLDEISYRLGMMQRAIYAGRCAGHPQAGGLVSNADQMLVTLGPRLANVQTTAEQTSTPVTDCVEPVPPGDQRNPTQGGIFRNTCPFAVYFSYCNVAPRPGSWADVFACETRARIALDWIAANGIVPAVLGREISHFACRKPALPVAAYAVGNGLEGFCK